MELSLYFFGLLTGVKIGDAIASSFTLTEQWDDIATSSFTISKDGQRNPYKVAGIPVGSIVVIDKHQLSGTFFEGYGWGGIITEIKENDNNYTITAREMRSLLKSQTTIDTTSMGSVVYATYFAGMLGEIVNSGDSAQNYSKWLYCDARKAPNTSGYLPSHTSNDIIDWDTLLQECMDLGNFVINYRFSISTGNTLSCTAVFEAVTDTILDINVGDGFISRPIFSQGSAEAVNKYIVKPSADNVLGSGTLIFYLHPDGSIDDEDENRITPVVEQTAIYTDSDYYSAEDFYQTSLANAKTAMSADDDSETTFTLYENKILMIKNFHPRQTIRIWMQGMDEPFVKAQLAKIEYKDSFTQPTLTIGYKKTRLSEKLSQSISKISSISNSTTAVSRNATAGNTGNAPKAGDGIIVTDNTKVSVDFEKVQSKIKVGTQEEFDNEKDQAVGDFYIVEDDDTQRTDPIPQVRTLEAKPISVPVVTSPPIVINETAEEESPHYSHALTLGASSTEANEEKPKKNKSMSLTLSGSNTEESSEEDTGSHGSKAPLLTLGGNSANNTDKKSNTGCLVLG